MVRGKPQRYLKVWEENLSLLYPTASLHQTAREAGPPQSRVISSLTTASGFISTFVIVQEL